VEGNAIAHQVNAEIRKLADRFEALDGAVRELTWLCVCGCFEQIMLSIADYDAAEGHVFAADHSASP
jgi:hypothetical protein